jgi:hypothetical protein
MTIALVAAAAAAVSACVSPSSSATVTPPSESPTGRTGGDAVVTLQSDPSGKRYLFRGDSPPVAVREASDRLAAAVPQIVGLRVGLLPSTSDAAALTLVEDSPQTKVWGTLLDQGKKAVFDLFAKHSNLGDWLILVTDVVVHRLQDPVPPTAYRWTRQEVQDYVACGIPDAGVNDCTRAFYREAGQVVLEKAPPPAPR